MNKELIIKYKTEYEYIKSSTRISHKGMSDEFIINNINNEKFDFI